MKPLSPESLLPALARGLGLTLADLAAPSGLGPVEDTLSWQIGVGIPRKMDADFNEWLMAKITAANGGVAPSAEEMKLHGERFDPCIRNYNRGRFEWRGKPIAWWDPPEIVVRGSGVVGLQNRSI